MRRTPRRGWIGKRFVSTRSQTSTFRQLSFEPLEPRALLAVDYTLQILHASDLEGGVPALDDAPRFSAVVNGLRDDYANTVVLSSGDNWIPGPFFTASDDPSLAPVLGTSGKGRGDVAMMNAIGFQAAAFGNHEFNEGTARVSSLLRPSGAYPGAQFPYLSANLDFSANSDLSNLVTADGQEWSAVRGKIAKSAVITVNGEQIGIVAATTPLLPAISSPGTVVTTPSTTVDPLTPALLQDLADEIQPAVDDLVTAGVNKIVLLTHLQNLTNEINLAPLLLNVDILIGGGSHRNLTDATDRVRAGFPSEGTYPIETTGADGKPMLIVNTEGNYAYVGRLVIGFDENGVVEPSSYDPVVSGAWATDNQGVIDAGNAAPDPKVVEIVNALSNVISSKDGNTFGKTDVYLNGERASVRTQETNFGNLTADANLAAAQSVDSSVLLSLKNGGGIRDAIGEIDPPTGSKLPPQGNTFKGPGEISQLDIENSLRFNNGLSLVTLTAEQLREVVEWGVAATGPGQVPGRFPQIGGFAFSFDASQPAGSRVHSLVIKDGAGNTQDVVVEGGELIGNPDRTFRMVTLDFLASGGDGYPFPAMQAENRARFNRVELISAGTTKTFDTFGSEQRALAEYLADVHSVTPFSQADVPAGIDSRIQNLAARSDTVTAPSPTGAVQLNKIGSIRTGGFDVGAAEISAYDPQTRRLFVVNAQASTIDVITLVDPANPRRISTLDISSFGSPNSVAISNGLVAVAVQNHIPQQGGRVVFYHAGNLQRLNWLPVGSLPDMVTFTPDGRYLLVANEGEPNTDYTVDPQGSVSIISIPSDIERVRTLRTRDVQGVGFQAYNNRKAELLSQGVRIYGPNATVAQDFEPEYIAVSSDSRTAYVTLQENNAYAVIDIRRGRVTDIIPFGYKDYMRPTSATLSTYELDDLPVLGTTAAGQEVLLGGLSGLFFEGYSDNGNYKFLAHTDRGPNGEPIGVRRPFLLPDFVPELVRLELDPVTGALTLTERIALTNSDGTPLTGLPNTVIVGGNGNTAYNDEVPIDLEDNVLPLDPLGADLEGIAIDPRDRTLWMVDEYRPAIYHFDATGKLIERFVPEGTVAAYNAGRPVAEQVSAGHFGTEALPAVLAQRRQNRGFEAVAFQNGKVYAFVQSPLRNPESLGNAALNAMQNIRVVEFDPATETTKQYLYIMDNAAVTGANNTRADKIGDAAAIGNGQFLVIERDDDAIDSDPAATIEKKIYRFSLAGATDISNLAGPVGETGKTVDQLTPQELAENGIHPIAKYLHVDLNEVGYNTVEKVEGLAFIGPDKIAVINDNDFGVAGITIDFETGMFTPDPNAEPIVLGIIETTTVGLDASDRGDSINIGPQPVFGMYQPDAIATYTFGGVRYLITANEGDARDYDAFAEEARISSLDLDPVAFPNAAALQSNSAIGRLNVTTALGDTDGDGDFDELYTLGGRSFSIWTADGSLVYDSGDDFERIVAEAHPQFFNASNTDNTFDSRSDNKGPEPEGLVTGVIGNHTYAFIGLERMSGIMVYDITEPLAPTFVTYVDNRDFAADPELQRAGDHGPEGLVFVPAVQSPNGRPLLIVANEVSGTVTIFEISIPAGQSPPAEPPADPAPNDPGRPGRIRDLLRAIIEEIAREIAARDRSAANLTHGASLDTANAELAETLDPRDGTEPGASAPYVSAVTAMRQARETALADWDPFDRFANGFWD